MSLCKPLTAGALPGTLAKMYEKGGSDADILRELHAAHHEVSEQLRETLTPALTYAAERVSHTIHTQPEIFNNTVNYHPVQEAPYTVIPPDMQLSVGPASGYMGMPAGTPIPEYVADFWQGHMQHNLDTPGIRDSDIVSTKPSIITHIQAELEQLRDGITSISQAQWETYQESHRQEHQRAFCVLGALAAKHGQRKYDMSTSGMIEQQMAAEHLPFRYTTNLYTPTSSRHYISSLLRIPLAPEVGHDLSERILRSAAFIVDHLAHDKQLLSDARDIAAAHPKLITQATQRALDTPHDLPRSIIHGLQESVCAGIAPVMVELLRTSDVALSEVTSGDWVRKIAHRSALGYVGPIVNKGVGMTDEMLRRENDEPKLSGDTKQRFEAMQKTVRRELHYPELVAYQNAQEHQAVPPPRRSGLYCPFVFGTSLLPSAISSFSDVLGNAIQQIEPAPQPTYDSTKPYRPWNVTQHFKSK